MIQYPVCFTMERTALNFSVILLAILLFSLQTSGTEVKRCAGKLEGDMLDVNLSACDKAPCLLKKGSTLVIEIKFKPQNEVKMVLNNVFSKVAGLAMPFQAVDGKSACANLYTADGSSPAECPLLPGTEYLYKNSIDILPSYPPINALVHWGLQDSSNRHNIACFEIQAKIVRK